MNPATKRFFALLLAVVLFGWLNLEEILAAEAEPIEGRIIQINEQKGTLTINGKVLDASDFELGDLQVGDRVMGEFVREKGRLRLIDLEVIK